ncbi:MAG: heme-binding protein [Flavobacteriales bacterium]|nr:heme-binding protein [Flavobacteriales bacterium]
MKTLLIVAIALAVILAASQLWAHGQVRQTETLPYQVVKAYPDFEVRRYATANFITVTMAGDTYRANSGQGFRTLAGYIFGGNATGQKIAMTSPVEMEMDSTVTMKFMLPAAHDPKDLPAPNDAAVRFSTERERTLAAITFSGFANDERIVEYKDLLFAALQREGIAHTGQWSLLGYDPPYRLIGRRNEVVVEVLP